MQRIFRLAYPVPPKDKGRRELWHQLRDGDAFAYIHGAIHEVHPGSRFAGVIRCVPDATTAGLGAGDVLVVNTRLPLDDRDTTRKKIASSGSQLEITLGVPANREVPPLPNGAARYFFGTLDRHTVHLQYRLKVDPRWRNLTFHDGPGAAVVDENNVLGTLRASLADLPPSDPDPAWTVAYFLHLPRAWPHGPALVWCFGMCGESGLLFAKIVSEHHTDWLREPTFAMCGFDLPPELRKSQDHHHAGCPGPASLDAYSASALRAAMIAELPLSADTLKTILGHDWP